jgi:osmotically-inducible protein OsmY
MKQNRRKNRMTHLSRISAILALVVAVAALSACERPDPERRASQALQEANLDEVRANWDDDARVLRLSGTVHNPADRMRAEEVAMQAVGTTGTVLNEVEVEGMEEYAREADRDIEERLDRMIEDDETWRDRDINFEVNQGAVMITGEVHSQEERQRIEQIVRNTEGVRDVANALEIRPAEQQRP